MTPTEARAGAAVLVVEDEPALAAAVVGSADATRATS